jgi:hypothetical protein
MKLLWIGFFLVIGCRHQTPQQKFVEFIKDPENKITQKIVVGNVTATVKWMPENYRKLIDSLTEETDEYDYFNVKFDKVGENKLSKEKTLYLDFDIQKDFALVIGKDSILPAICQRIQNGRSSSYEYMLAFEKQKNVDKDFAIAYKDEIFGIGTLAFIYKQEDIKKIPTLAAK